MIELKLEVGVPSGKLKKPPKSCIPSRAKINMNRKSRNNSDKIEDMAFIRAITRFLSEDQYLKWKEGHLHYVLQSCHCYSYSFCSYLFLPYLEHNFLVVSSTFQKEPQPPTLTATLLAVNVACGQFSLRSM